MKPGRTESAWVRRWEKPSGNGRGNVNSPVLRAPLRDRMQIFGKSRAPLNRLARLFRLSIGAATAAGSIFIKCSCIRAIYRWCRCSGAVALISRTRENNWAVDEKAESGGRGDIQYCVIIWRSACKPRFVTARELEYRCLNTDSDDWHNTQTC